MLVERTCRPAGRNVKEDLKRIHLHPLKKYPSNQIVREQQIYGLTRIFGNKAVTLPVRMDDNKVIRVWQFIRADQSLKTSRALE